MCVGGGEGGTAYSRFRQHSIQQQQQQQHMRAMSPCYCGASHCTCGHQQSAKSQVFLQVPATRSNGPNKFGSGMQTSLCSALRPLPSFSMLSIIKWTKHCQTCRHSNSLHKNLPFMQWRPHNIIVCVVLLLLLPPDTSSLRIRRPTWSNCLTTRLTAAPLPCCPPTRRSSPSTRKTHEHLQPSEHTE